MPKLAKPIQGILVLILAVIVGIGLLSVVGNNDDEGFLGTTNKVEIEVPLATPDPTDGEATPDPLATPEATDDTGENSEDADMPDEPVIDDTGSDATTITEEYQSPLGADVNLIFQALMFVGLLVGASFAVRKDYTTHRNIMTFLIIVNWFSIMGRMADSADGIRDTDVNEVVASIHMLGGSIVMLFATYLAIRMWFEDILPGWLKIEPIKLWMRLTLVVWLSILVLGLVIYMGLYS